MIEEYSLVFATEKNIEILPESSKTEILQH